MESVLKTMKEDMKYAIPILKPVALRRVLLPSKNNAQRVIVFEGFYDFLSFMSLTKNQDWVENDFVILNSVSFFVKARPFVEHHSAVKRCLDRDETDYKFSKYALFLSDRYTDESDLYKLYKDFNNWLINFGKTPPRNAPL